jgi:N-methylhydantoinase A
MERALRVISVERGYDPRQFTLLSFGGAGGLHAADLARRLCVKTVLVPPMASTLSALGMLAADIIKDYSQTVMLAGDTSPGELEIRYSPLLDRGLTELRQAGYTDDQAVIEKSLDMRYLGQSFELSVPYTEQFLADFHSLHYQRYGYYRQEAAIEIVNLRLRLIVPVEKPVLPARELASPDPVQAFLGLRPVILDQAGAPEAVPFYRGEDLLPGNRLRGPALVLRSDTTILLSAADVGLVDGFNNLWIRIGS